MSVRKLKPITPGQRFRIVNNFDEIKTPKKRIFQVKGLIVDEPLERLS